jgi:hypothetical protein
VKPVKLAAILIALGLGLGSSTLVLAQEAVTLKMPGGGQYIGTVTNGVPDGTGYFKDPDGMQYEGEVHMGRREGVAEGLFPNRDNYKGEWKDGKPDGIGTMIYALGGSYEGEWRNGQRHGKGVMTFSGSGRRAEVRFDHGRRIDATAEAPSAAAASATYSLSSGSPPLGSNLPDKIGFANVPMDVGFDGLTPDQQRVVRARYPALDVGDDPPYPLKGSRELFTVLSKLGRYFISGDDLLVYATVGADGKVVSVSTIADLPSDVKRTIGSAAALIKYKPAQCGGQPCQGVMVYHLKLTVRH